MSAVSAPASDRAPGESDADRIARLEAENAMLREKLRLHGLSLAEAEGSASMPTSLPSQVAEQMHHPNTLGGVSWGHNYDGGLLRFTNTWDDTAPTFPARPSFDRAPNHPSTDLVSFDGCPGDPYHPSSMPIYQTATFVQPNIQEFGAYDYTRSGNPTRTALETLSAKLEAAHASFAFTSGMAALANLVSLFDAGTEIIAVDDLYGGMHRLLTQVAARQGIAVKFVDTSTIEALRCAINPGVTKLVHVESPTNPLMRVSDLKAIAEVAHEFGAFVSVDCTMMTPVRCQPLLLGCDFVIHSATKFFSGHSDVMGGFLSVRDPSLAKRAAFNQNAVGTALAPFDSWLMLRGLKTLALRVERQESNALVIATYLAKQRQFVTRLNYAGLNPELPEAQGILSTTRVAYDIHRRQCTGPGTVVSFETGDVARSKRFVDACRLFKLTVSFGSCNSLVEMPCALSHASIPKDKRTLPEDLIRLSIGVEHVQDLIRDLARAIRCALNESSPSPVGSPAMPSCQAAT